MGYLKSPNFQHLLSLTCMFHETLTRNAIMMCLCRANYSDGELARVNSNNKL